MLRQTFLHVPGIGRKMERSLWEQGCDDWDCLLAHPEQYSFGTAARNDVVREIERSRQCLEEGVHQHFRQPLGLGEAWRAFPEFRDRCVYLDIETDGSKGGDSVTTIGMWDGRAFQCLIKGRDLEEFRDRISHYSMIVTFFGAGFDLPVLEQRFPGLVFDQIHLDLCPALRKIGYRGGLKNIERVLGIPRAPEIEHLTGLDAVKLWRAHQWRGSERALETLIAYNKADVVNLERLAEFAYARLRRDTLGVVQRTLIPPSGD
ncbi:MAG: ribonuclease H-like domain-containing protein [Fimbriimonadaceae bacterium]|nr:ribonuclease H-like domain-containing protein [Fimbriimonadaceae bacterium]